MVRCYIMVCVLVLGGIGQVVREIWYYEFRRCSSLQSLLPFAVQLLDSQPSSRAKAWSGVAISSHLSKRKTFSIFLHYHLSFTMAPPGRSLQGSPIKNAITNESCTNNSPVSNTCSLKLLYEILQMKFTSKECRERKKKKDPLVAIVKYCSTFFTALGQEKFKIWIRQMKVPKNIFASITFATWLVNGN